MGKRKKYKHTGIDSPSPRDRPWGGDMLTKKTRVYPLGRPGRITDVSDKEFDRFNKAFEDYVGMEKRAEEYSRSLNKPWNGISNPNKPWQGLQEYPDEHPCPECGTVWPVELKICEKCGMDMHKSWLLIPDGDIHMGRGPFDGVDCGEVTNGAGRVSRKVRN